MALGPAWLLCLQPQGGVGRRGTAGEMAEGDFPVTIATLVRKCKRSQRIAVTVVR